MPLWDQTGTDFLSEGRTVAFTIDIQKISSPKNKPTEKEKDCGCMRCEQSGASSDGLLCLKYISLFLLDAFSLLCLFFFALQSLK